MTIFAILLFLTLCCTPISADHKMLTVGVEDLSYLPYGTVREGKYQGFARDLLDAFAARSAYDLEYQPMPVKRLFHEFMVARSVDLKFPDNPAWLEERYQGQRVIYSDPVCEYTDGIMVRPEDVGKGLERIEVLGAISGFEPWLVQPELGTARVKISENQSVSGLLGKGITGRVDAIYTNVEVARRLLRSMGAKGQLVFDPSLPHNVGEYRLSTLHEPQMIEDFNLFLKSNRPLINEIRRDHGLEPLQ